MAKLTAVLGLSSVSARLFKFAERLHGNTIARFGSLLALNNARVSKQVALLVGSTLEYLESGSRVAGAQAWKSIRDLDSMLPRLQPAQLEAARFELERSTQMLLSQDPDLAKLILDDIEKYGLTRLRKITKGLAKQPSVDAAVRAAWRQGAYAAGGDLLLLFKRFEGVVGLDTPGVVKAAEYITMHAAEIRSAAKAAQKGNKAQLLGHLSGVRGLLGEAYALLCAVWRTRHRALLKEAKKAARKLGPGWEALSISQLENKIKLGAKEGADQMIVLVNRTRTPAEAIAFVSAQVKTANVSEAVGQTIYDVFKRELGPGLLEFTYAGKAEVCRLVQHEAITARRFILNAAESRIPATDISLLQRLNVEVSEIVLDTSVSQFSVLAAQMIEDGLAALKKVSALAS